MSTNSNQELSIQQQPSHSEEDCADLSWDDSPEQFETTFSFHNSNEAPQSMHSDNQVDAEYTPRSRLNAAVNLSDNSPDGSLTSTDSQEDTFFLSEISSHLAPPVSNFRRQDPVRRDRKQRVKEVRVRLDRSQLLSVQVEDVMALRLFLNAQLNLSAKLMVNILARR